MANTVSPQVIRSLPKNAHRPDARDGVEFELKYVPHLPTEPPPSTTQAPWRPRPCRLKICHWRFPRDTAEGGLCDTTADIYQSLGMSAQEASGALWGSLRPYLPGAAAPYVAQLGASALNASNATLPLVPAAANATMPGATGCAVGGLATAGGASWMGTAGAVAPYVLPPLVAATAAYAGYRYAASRGQAGAAANEQEMVPMTQV